MRYLTCNERHHELMLIQDPVRRGYDHIGLEVEDAAALEAAPVPEAAGGRMLGDVYDGEPGIDRALRVLGPRRPRIQALLRHGERTGARARRPPDQSSSTPPSRRHGPSRWSASSNAAWASPSATAWGRLASWWHCDADHHGMAVVLAPHSELSHYAYAVEDLNPMGRVADRLKHLRDQRLIWGPSRHGPGKNCFIYLHDHDGAMIELRSELAQMSPAGAYRARRWPIDPTTNQPMGRPATAEVPARRLPHRHARRGPAGAGRCGPTAPRRPGAVV